MKGNPTARRAGLIGAEQPGGNVGGYWVVFVLRRTTMLKSTPAEQAEQLPYNHYLQQFLTFLK
jgi:hypothetical protein